MTDETQEPHGAGVTRRTVTRAVAWAAPAILMASPVPASAASVPPARVTARCGVGSDLTGYIDVSITDAPLGARLELRLGGLQQFDGTLSVVPPSGWTGQGVGPNWVGSATLTTLPYEATFTLSWQVLDTSLNYGVAALLYIDDQYVGAPDGFAWISGLPGDDGWRTCYAF